jgi:hypothetical protein
MSEKNRQRRKRDRQRRKSAAGQTPSSRVAKPDNSPAVRGEPGPPPAPGGRNVVVAIASSGRIHEQTLGSIQAMIRATTQADTVAMWWNCAEPKAWCRNLLVERFLKDKTRTHLVFVDSQIVVPPNGLDLLLEVDKPLVCSPVAIAPPRPVDPFKAPIYDLSTSVMEIADPDHRGRTVPPEDGDTRYVHRDYDSFPESPFECDAASAGFCCIRRDVLESMEPPWFRFVDRPDRKIVQPELYFFRRANQSGYALTVQPAVMCDNVQRADLTHIEQFFVPRSVDPPWEWNRREAGPATIVYACTTDRWIDFKTAEVILRWQEETTTRIGVRLLEASDAAWAMARLQHEDAIRDNTWDRVLILGPDVVPEEDLLFQLASVDAPIVVPLTRAMIQGDIAYSCGTLDPLTGQIQYSGSLSPDELSRPFEAHSVDLTCCMIQREMFKHTHDAITHAITERDPVAAFNRRFVDLVREDTGRNPVVVPVMLERRVDVGLLGLLQLKHKLRQQHAESAKTESVTV